MNNITRQSNDYGFVMGLFAGTVVGAGLMMWLVPKATSELRGRITDSANALGTRATEGYEHASAEVGRVIGDVTRKGQAIRNDVADAAVAGAQNFQRVVIAAKAPTVMPEV